MVAGTDSDSPLAGSQTRFSQLQVYYDRRQY